MHLLEPYFGTGRDIRTQRVYKFQSNLDAPKEKSDVDGNDKRVSSRSACNIIPEDGNSF